MDMTGNVFEWVADMFDAAYYSYSPYYNPQGPAWSRHYLGDEIDLPDRPYFTIRGGSCCDNWWYGRVAHRHWGHHGDIPNTDRPFFRTYRVGFRCARSIIE
jgi:formylglycine-generating enzyme required for sulfatase activity